MPQTAAATDATAAVTVDATTTTTTTAKTRHKGREETEAQRLSRILVETAQKRHGITVQDVAEPLAMHGRRADDTDMGRRMQIWKGHPVSDQLWHLLCSRQKGLCLDMSLDILDSYHADDKTVTIYYFEPQWKDGYDDASRRDRKAENQDKGRYGACRLSLHCKSVRGQRCKGGKRDGRARRTVRCKDCISDVQ